MIWNLVIYDIILNIFESLLLLLLLLLFNTSNDADAFIYLLHTKFMVLFIFLHFTSCLYNFILLSDLSFATGETIPAGAALVVPVQLVQTDDSSWGSDASDFNPYRFLSNGGKGCDEVLAASKKGSIPSLYVILRAFVFPPFVSILK